jgi:UDP-glucose 4-epimerase
LPTWPVCERFLIASKCVAVMHLAAFAYVGESVEKPLLYYQNNIGGSANLFRAIIETRTIPVIFSSTCATYGVPKKIPIPEEHPQNPINPYGSCKLMVERILADLGLAHGLRWIALRYFTRVPTPTATSEKHTIRSRI